MQQQSKVEGRRSKAPHPLAPAVWRSTFGLRRSTFSAALFLFVFAAQAQVIVPTNSVWRFFRGTNEASAPAGTEWRTNTFDDSTWETAPSPFYFGPNYSPAGGTLLSDMQSNYSCVFLRSTFYLSNATLIIGLSNRPYCDDGYIAWINGQEVRRINVGASSFVAYTNTATTTVSFNTWAGINQHTNKLRTGTNVFAVQYFNVSRDDLDFFANPELAVVYADIFPPTVLSTTPAPNSTVTNLSQFTVTFSESVTNVRATDLRVNGQGAIGVSGTNATYTFSLVLPPAGNVQITWNPAAAIKDLSGNAFSDTNVVWTVTHFIIPPYVASAVPPFGSVVSNLTTVTVAFNTPVSGLLASDFSVAGYAAASVSGSGTTYTFTLPPQLPNGVAPVSWDINQTIVDSAGVRMNEASNTWTYTLVDSLSPSVASLTPAAGASVGGLTQVEVLFSEPVSGVDAPDLLVNGQVSQSVFGSGAGPYIFQFPQPPTGAVQFAWSAGHNIRDNATNPFTGTNWTVTLNPGAFLGDIVINEFAAANVVSNAPLDFSEFGQAEDWIELYNRGASPVRLLGWSLTDDSTQPGLWTFPDATLAAGQYLVVYASGADRKVVGGTNRLHTNFKLNPNGDYLALFNAQSPRVAVSEFSPQFPEQRNDYSYGLNPFNEWRYYQTPTPGGPNGNSPITNIVAKPKLNVAHGLFEQPFTLVASCDTPGATMRFTVDGTAPSEVTGQVYLGPLVVSNTTIFRIAAYLTNRLPSRVTTHSYVFLGGLLTQSNTPPGYPTIWQGVTGDTTAFQADYEMDPEILTNAPNSALVAPALKALPVVSIALRPSDMFSSTNGIYVNPEPPTAQRYLWERACSVELMLTNDEPGFQIDCGIRLQGNASRTPSKTEKHPFRLLFKGDYGPGTLDYPLFPDSPVESFDGVVLRADFNNSWVHWDSAQRPRGTKVRDGWGKATFGAMGQFAGHTRYCHLLINGLYWGIYEFNERIDADFASRYLGGNSTDWDAIVSKPTEAIDGDMVAYNAMIANVRSRDLRVLSNYTAALTYLDVTNFVEYMLLNFYGGNGDWGFDGNWNALHRRASGALFQYFIWDVERILEGTGDNRVTSTDVPSGLHTNLVNSAEYKLFFADRVQKHLFNNGALTSNQMIGRWLGLANALSTAMVAESARWGDNRRDVMTTLGGGTAPFLLYDRTTNWLPEINRVATNYFPGRATPFLNQLISAGLYPTVSAPAFNQHGGRVASGFALTMSATNPIYYTTNGQDPRVYGSGTISPLAQPYGAPIALSQSTVVKARTLFGTNWSALTEATFAVNSLLVPLRITELMYNPIGGDPYEFIELQNTGPLPLTIGNYSFGGITFTFPFGFTLAAGQRIVLGNGASTNAFKTRYPGVNVAGWFAGSLSNGGEIISVFDATGRTVLSVSYDDERGWPTAPDGTGYSLEIIDASGEPDAPANWRASSVQNGTPGQSNSVPPAASVVLNEVMADNVAAVNHEGTFPDWVELFNTTAGPIDLGNWSLTDDGNARKFVFPGGTTIAPGDYLVVWCDALTNTTSGLHSGFALGRNGESVLLYDANTNRIDAISFGPQVADYSIGRVGSSWTLAVPTASAANIAATLAAPAALSINEWLANSAPGFDDWVELFNTSSNAPVALRNVYLGTSNALFQIRSLSFVAPGGFMQLIADELAGPDHLDFKLAAGGGAIVLYDATGAELQRITYGAQGQGLSQGRLPNGSATIVSFTNSASPGASNYLLSYAGPILNELLARNSSAVPGPFGNYPDYVEIYNPTTNAYIIGGMGLSDDAGQVKFTFAPGTTVEANGFLVVWCDENHPSSASGDLNSGFALSGSSGGVYLFNALGQMVNSIEYGFQVRELPIGVSGNQWVLLSAPTPGTTNAPPAALGATANLRINEWMATPASGDDWFEIYNNGSLPVNLSGLFVTDDPSLAGLSNTPIATLSYIGGKDWVKWIADGHRGDGRDHAGFSLDADGETIRLYASDFSILDSVSFGTQAPGVSEGRLPDGGSNIVSFPATPTPEASNYLPLDNVVINEVLTHTDPPLEDAIEIQNISSNSVDIGNWWISNSQRDLKKFRLPAGLNLAPGQFKVFYENEFDADGSGTGTNFTLNAAQGDSVYLSATDPGGNPNGHRAQISFGAAANGVSFGRFATSTGVDFTAMAERTFGSDNPATLADFRTGAGLSNSYPRVGPIVINEIMYHPVSGTNAAEIPEQEFIELHNVTPNPVPMFDTNNPANAWKLSGGVTFNFSSNITIGATGHLTLVAFDPVTNVLARLNFRAKYGSNGALAGPFSGRLDNAGEALELYRPDSPQPPPHPDAGFVPMILVDRVVYDESAPWPAAADGGGASLQRLAPLLYGNEALNWGAQPPTAGAPNTQGSLVPPTISGQPQSQAALQGTSVVFSVTAQGTAPLGYQWFHAGIIISGASGPTLTVTGVQPADGGLYRVVVTNAAGSIVSQSATLTVLAPPFIDTPPQSQTAIAGVQVQFNVAAGGTAPLYYQWRFNNGDLIGQNAAQLTLNNVQPSSAGNYTVVITNNYGARTSIVAVLSVNVPPVITDEPDDLTVLANDPATFTVSATGTAPLSYQWRKDNVDIPGANSSSYAIAAAQPSDEGLYWVVVTNAGGMATSLAASLRVNSGSFLSNAHRHPDGVFEFTLTGQTNRNYAVEFSSDLIGWAPLTNVVLSAPQGTVIDSGATNAWWRFYRVRTGP